MTSDKELEYIEKLGFLKGENHRLQTECNFLWRRLDEERAKAQANWEIVESVAIGEKLYCEKCKTNHPCMCDGASKS